MVNYQLYRTNILLGGQMKYDLIIKDSMVDDIRITPVSNRAPYKNRFLDTNILNYTNQSNIKEFYKITNGNFYNTYVDPLLASEYPLIDPSVKTYDDSTWMGGSRMEYKLYEKQFQFFVPLWIETKPDKLSFKVKIDIVNGPTLTDKEIVVIGEGSKVSNYFKDYFEFIEQDDRLIKIDFDKNECVLHGLNVETGLLETKKEFTLVPTLKYRERPLLEFDSMIINSLVNNKLIAKQLINFNLCFNVEDLVDPGIFKVINLPDTYSFKISVKTILDGKELEIVDFFNNYEKIEKKLIPTINEDELLKGEVVYKKTTTFETNVLDYLKDYDCVDLININKSDQKIIHWSLNDSNDYIFNLYDGYDGITFSEQEIHHKYGTSFAPPSILYSQNEDSWAWAPYINIPPSALSRIKFNALKKCTIPFARFSQDTCFGLDLTKLDTKYHYMIVIYSRIVEDYELRGIFGDCQIFYNNNDKKYVVVEDNVTKYKYIFIVSNSISNIIYNSVLNDLKIFSDQYNGASDPKVKEDLEDLKNFYNYLNSLIVPKTIVIEKSIYGKLAPSPNRNSKEKKYYKVDTDFLQYLIRYDGNIKPTFITPNSNYFNYLYEKKCLVSGEDKDGNKIYNTDDGFLKFLDPEFEPRFKSIGYYPYKNEKKLNYDSPMFNKDNNEELKWFNNSILINKPTRIVVDDVDSLNVDDLYELISYTKIPQSDSDKKSYKVVLGLK